jgi:tRNA-specific 2-thiouridylase
MVKRKKILVALSGGVDSSTAAAILQRDGLDCAGAFMVTSNQATVPQAKAKRMAERLGIKLYVLDLRKDFEQILDYFCGEYERGRTPNPCVLCNRNIKFGKLWDFARANGAELLATGHYARILKNNSSPGLYAATDTTKDQSYALSMIDRNILGHIVLPIGNYCKNETREMAAKLGLAVEEEPESQEICFIPDDDYIAIVEKSCPQIVRRGNIVDSNGRVLGEHNGVHRFTIGQRRGLSVAMGKPYYVVKIDAESNTVTLGPKEELMHSKLLATAVNWLTDEPRSAFRAKVKIRYNGDGADATVSPQPDGVVVEFNEPVPAITPGQLAVFYVQQDSGEKVVGGGWIERTND